MFFKIFFLFSTKFTILYTRDVPIRAHKTFSVICVCFIFLLEYLAAFFLKNGLFVYLEFIVPIENFSLIWRRPHCRWRAANFDLCSVLMAIEQWGFFSVSHLLWHGPSLYNGHLQGPVTLTPVAERLAVVLSLPVFTT